MVWTYKMSSQCWCCPECLSVSDSEERNEDQNALNELRYFYELQQDHPLFHLTKVLQYHPSYLQCFLETYTYLLHEPGPLPQNMRIYIAIMAVSRHQCHHLLNLLHSEFLSSRGDDKWLRGLEEAPEKLRNLDEVNKILAHRPWLLETTHILKLTKGSRENWSISELTQAITILVFHHSIVSLFASCGIGVEEINGSSPTVTQEPGNSQQQHLPPPPLQRQVSEVYGIDILLERMKLVEETSEDVTPEERLARFKDIERQSVNLLNSKKRKKKSNQQNLPSPFFTNDLDFTYEDFATEMNQRANLQPFPMQDYSWEIHGYSVASLYYGDSAPVLDSKFKVAQTLTYNMVGTYPNVDTRTFRTAVWNYTQCLLGIMHDDYDYEFINTLLEKNLRSYVKVATCFPETVTRASYEGFMKDLLPSEKVHVNIMIHEARFQAELLYGFRAITSYMNTDW